jgi:RNA polymerase sigma-70 factor, ECF subfamily
MSLGDPGQPDVGHLVRRARAGDDLAFEEIVSLFGRRVGGYCRRMAGPQAAEDLAQEVFVKVYLALATLDPERPLAPFLFRTAHNHCVDWLRKARAPLVPLSQSGPGGSAAVEFDPPDLSQSPDRGLRRAELAEAMERAFAALPIEYRSAVLLRHREGLTYEEIAAILEIPLATVKTRIHRGRERLKQSLQEFVVPSGRRP